MIITHFGAESFKVQFGDITLAFNPISKDSKLKSSRYGADIALMSLNHPDTNGVDQVSFGEKEAFVIKGPGEYEVKGVTIKGFKSESLYGGKPRINTIYTVNLENMNVCFLGALSSKDLSSETMESIDEIDILFVPIGGEGVLTPSDAYKLAVKLEAKIVIPMHYTKETLKQFLKEGGDESIKPEDKLTLKKKDLEGKKVEIVVLAENA